MPTLGDRVQRFEAASLQPEQFVFRPFVLAMLTLGSTIMRAFFPVAIFVMALSTSCSRSGPSQLSTISDPDLQILATKRPLIPLTLLTKAESGTSTNKAGTVVSREITVTFVNGEAVTNETTHIPQTHEVCRWVLYTFADNGIGTRYFVMFKADGSLDYVDESKCDAIEFDSKYQKINAEVEAEVEAEMRKDGSYGRFGSVRTFWNIKQEKLNARGVPWSPPSAFNPNINYD